MARNRNLNAGYLLMQIQRRLNRFRVILVIVWNRTEISYVEDSAILRENNWGHFIHGRGERSEEEKKEGEWTGSGHGPNRFRVKWRKAESCEVN